MPLILGGGVTGLSAGLASGWPVYEAESEPGGICSSYYVRPGEQTRLPSAPGDDEAYRFEIGGGHWIFGGDPVVLRLIERATPLRRYSRVSGVYFPKSRHYIPYPLQDHLRLLAPPVAAQALIEIAQPKDATRTMKDWLSAHFGPTLCGLFFHPFHDLYTAGLYDRIAPQDPFKSPIRLDQVIQGAFGQATAAGYNVSYAYPEGGLNGLAHWMSSSCDIRYGKRAVRIDPAAKEVGFADGSSVGYDTLISTLPLHRTLDLARLTVEGQTDPCTAVLVLNIGALRGSACPPDHWLYIPESRAGFHRVGFYSNVDASFLPLSARKDNSRVSIYVERAFPEGSRPTESATARYAEETVRELQDWGYIERADVVNPTWIDVAYTWSWPGSRWPARAIARLAEHGIYATGRYGRWMFQGIADSIRDGLFAGAALKNYRG